MKANQIEMLCFYFKFLENIVVINHSCLLLENESTTHDFRIKLLIRIVVGDRGIPNFIARHRASIGGVIGSK